MALLRRLLLLTSTMGNFESAELFVMSHKLSFNTYIPNHLIMMMMRLGKAVHSPAQPEQH